MKYDSATLEAAIKIAQSHLDLIKDHHPDVELEDKVAQGYGNAAMNILFSLECLRGEAE